MENDSPLHVTSLPSHFDVTLQFRCDEPPRVHPSAQANVHSVSMGIMGVTNLRAFTV